MHFMTGQSAQKVHRSLQASVHAMEQAEHTVVLWFAEVLDRKLYRELGYGSIQQYAAVELGFSRT